MTALTLQGRPRHLPRLGIPQLRLDPGIQARMAALAPALRAPRLRQLVLQPNWLRLQQSELDRMLSQPPAPGSPPLVPRGAGPAQPRAGEVSDLLSGLWAVPDVQLAGTRLLQLAQQRVERDWSRTSPTERALVIATGVVIGGSAVAVVLGDSQTRRSALGLVEGLGAIPVPGVDGLTFSLSPTGGGVGLQNAGVRGLGVRVEASLTGNPGHPLDCEAMVTFDLMRYLEGR